MRRFIPTLTAAIVGTLACAAIADACSAIKSNVQLEMFHCASCAGGGERPEAEILTVSGTLALSNRRATPELASLVVEIEAKVGGQWTALARRVLNENGDDVVETCEGIFASDAMPGRLVLVDAAGNPLPFAAVKQLPEGTTALRYVASFGGPIAGLGPGAKARARVFATAIGADATGTCDIDANNDSVIDLAVKTHAIRALLRVPATALALMP